MITLRANNNYTYVDYSYKSRDLHDKIYNTLRSSLAYDVPSAEYSDKFKAGMWDGKISVYDGRNRRFPSGLTDLALQKLSEQNLEVSLEDQRATPAKEAKFSANYGNRVLREYQKQGPLLVSKHTRGILAYGTGSGKTLTLCEILVQIQCKPVCIVVPGISLLRQTVKEIENVIQEHNKPIKVGRVGGNEFLITNGINVCTYHSMLSAYNSKFVESKNQIISDVFSGDKVKKTLSQLRNELESAKKIHNSKLIKKISDQISSKEELNSRKQAIKEMIEGCSVLIVDECHLAAEIIEFISLKAELAYYKIGLSATPWREDNQEIRIEGAIGRVLDTVSSSELIKANYLCKPTILMFKLHSKSLCSGYQDCYSKNLIHNDYRNSLIKNISTECFSNYIPTVILVERIEHGKVLQDLIPNSIFVPGKEKGEEDPDDKELDYRRRMLNKLANNDHILIATQWIYTGIDCPPMQCLILAGSTASSVTTYQQVGRVLRLSPETNKQFALIIDFYDMNRFFKPHAIRRKKTYERETEYDLRIIKK